MVHVVYLKFVVQKAVCFRRNRDTYAGEYFADKMHGFGVYSFANEHRYEGSWHEGKRQGFGVYTFRNGETRSGHWQNGVLEISPPLPEYRCKVLNAVQVMLMNCMLLCSICNYVFRIFRFDPFTFKMFDSCHVYISNGINV